FYGNQDLSRTSHLSPGEFSNKLFTPKTPYYKRRKVINRTRSFVRTELSRFISQEPSASVVPATATDEDVRSAYAAEQVWESLHSTQKFPVYFRRAMWW